MSIKNFYCSKEGKNTAQIMKLDYGTLVINVPNGNDNVYIKVKSRKEGSGLHVGKKYGNSVLLNLKYGTLRQIPANTIVKVVSGNLELSLAEAKDHFK